MPSHILDQQQTDILIDRAVSARQNAYAPYSKFKVGAAILTSEETIYSGCNVENSSYGLCICAERTAICSSIAAGEQGIIAVAVAAVPLAMPCGACRQFIYEFGKDITIICVDANDTKQRSVRSIESLIPDCFSFDS